MSPDLKKQEPPPQELVKFVRDEKDGKDMVAWDFAEETDHAEIAGTNNLGEKPPAGSSADVLVRDSGLLANMGTNYLVTGESSNVVPRGNASQARDETLKVVKEITGKEAKKG